MSTAESQSESKQQSRHFHQQQHQLEMHSISFAKLASDDGNKKEEERWYLQAWMDGCMLRNQ
jgi:hypothetical protein